MDPTTCRRDSRPAEISANWPLDLNPCVPSQLQTTHLPARPIYTVSATTVVPTPPNEQHRVGSAALGGALVGLSATEMVWVRLPSREVKFPLGVLLAKHLSSTGAGLGLLGELFDSSCSITVHYSHLLPCLHPLLAPYLFLFFSLGFLQGCFIRSYFLNRLAINRVRGQHDRCICNTSTRSLR
jgi:hypothetical protein